MTETSVVEKTMNDAATPLKLDAAVIGAGVAGLYQLHLLRQQGMNVKAFDAASGVGGTWYWNRYPGARFDSEGYIYQYLFSEDLYKGWSWSEKFPASRRSSGGSIGSPTNSTCAATSSSRRGSRARASMRRPGTGS
jgi:monoamine oxidase